MSLGLGSRMMGGLVVSLMATLTSSSLGAAHRAELSPVKARIVHELQVDGSDIDKLASAPYRAHFGRTDLYIPTFFHPEDGAYDLIVHFHGLSAAQESNVERSRVNAIVASINLGIGSGAYEDAFKNPWSFPQLLKVLEKAIAKSGRTDGAHLGRIALSAWSAGYGSVSAILRVPSNAKRIDAVLLADGLHSDYTDERRHVVDDGPLAKYVKVAEQAIKGDKLFALTHSSIATTGYPNTTETIGELLKLVGVAKEPMVSDGPRGMLEIYESHRGNFHVKGFLGTGVKDHIDHIWGMNETLLPYLRDRWSR
ncbi:MAG: hypothetical protein ACLQBL_01910 [Polyangiaceae bacterium]